MANTNSPLKMANTNTPLKTIFRCEGNQSLRTEPHCFICLRSPPGKLRNIVTNVALPDNNPILRHKKMFKHGFQCTVLNS